MPCNEFSVVAEICCEPDSIGASGCIEAEVYDFMVELRTVDLCLGPEDFSGIDFPLESSLSLSCSCNRQRRIPAMLVEHCHDLPLSNMYLMQSSACEREWESDT